MSSGVGCPCRVKKVNCCPPRTPFVTAQTFKPAGSERRFCFPEVIRPDSVSIDDLDYGNSIAISGNGQVMAIGAPLAKIEGIEATGVVFIYERKKTYSPCPSTTDRDFYLKQIIWAVDPKTGKTIVENGDRFGFSVAVSYTGAFIVVGAPDQEFPSPSPDAGSAFMFVRSGQKWFAAQQLKADYIDDEGNVLPDTFTQPGYGEVVAISRDDRILIVSNKNYRLDSERSETGAVYLYERCATSFGVCDPPKNLYTLQQRILASKMVSTVPLMFALNFGLSIAISGNGQFLFVGSDRAIPTEFSGLQANSNAVLVFQRSSPNCGNWIYSQYLTANDTSPFDIGTFGSSLSVTPDARFLVVMNPFERFDESTESSGVIYAFQATTCNESFQTQYAFVDKFNPTPTSETVATSIGTQSLEISDDGCFVAAGYSQATIFEIELAGQVVTFERKDLLQNGVRALMWDQKQVIYAPTPEIDETFGVTIAMNGNASTLAVGAIGLIKDEEVIVYSSKVKSCTTTQVI